MPRCSFPSFVHWYLTQLCFWNAKEHVKGNCAHVRLGVIELKVYESYIYARHQAMHGECIFQRGFDPGTRYHFQSHHENVSHP